MMGTGTPVPHPQTWQDHVLLKIERDLETLGRDYQQFRMESVADRTRLTVRITDTEDRLDRADSWRIAVLGAVVTLAVGVISTFLIIVLHP